MIQMLLISEFFVSLKWVPPEFPLTLYMYIGYTIYIYWIFAYPILKLGYLLAACVRNKLDLHHQGGQSGAIVSISLALVT